MKSDTSVQIIESDSSVWNGTRGFKIQIVKSDSSV